MTRHTIRLIAVLIPFAGCQSNERERVQIATSGIGDESGVSAACTILPGESATTATLTAEITVNNRPLTLRRIAVVNADRATLSNTFQYGNELVLDLRLDRNLDTTSIAVNYGPAAGGITAAHFTIAQGSISGTIDGRALVPAPVGTPTAELAFADGGPAPTVTIDPNVTAAMAVLEAAARERATSCATPYSESGHDSSPAIDIACASCWAGCAGASSACLIGAAAGCAAAGPFYGICFAAAAVVCAAAQLTCMAVCNADGNACCPVTCGEVACCDDGESCLNSTTGLCCSPGLKPCAGQSCCESTEICMPSGAQAGTCCPAAQKCGDTCCGPLDTCNDGKCCGFGEQACDNTCCGINERCVGGDECCAADKACGNKCCDANQVCVDPAHSVCDQVCERGDLACPDGSCCPGGTSCTGVPGVCCKKDEYFCHDKCQDPYYCF